MNIAQSNSRIRSRQYLGIHRESRTRKQISSKNYMFSIENAAINGLSANPLFATEVAPSKKALKEINFADHTLKENGIAIVLISRLLSVFMTTTIGQLILSQKKPSTSILTAKNKQRILFATVNLVILF